MTFRYQKYLNTKINQYLLTQITSQFQSGAEFHAISDDGTECIFRIQELINQSETEVIKTLQQLLKQYPTIHDFFQFENQLCTIISKIKTTLEKVLYSQKNKKIQDEQEIRKIVLQIATAIQSLHKKKFIHRNINLENISQLYSGNYVLTGFELMTQQDRLELTQYVGHHLYMAPDKFEVNYTEAVDIWSLGLILLELKQGFFEYDEGLKMIHSTMPKEFKIFNDQVLNEVLNKTIKHDPKERAQIDEIVQLLTNQVEVKIIDQPRVLNKCLTNPLIKLPPQQQEPDSQNILDMNTDMIKQRQSQLIKLQQEFESGKQAIQILEQQSEVSLNNFQTQYLNNKDLAKYIVLRSIINDENQKQGEQFNLMKDLWSQINKLTSQNLEQLQFNIAQFKNQLEISGRDKSQFLNEKTLLQQELEAIKDNMANQELRINQVKEEGINYQMLNRKIAEENQQYEATIIKLNQITENLRNINKQAVQSLQDKCDQNNYLCKLTEDLKKQLNEKDIHIDRIQKELVQQECKVYKLAEQQIKKETQDIQEQLKNEISKLQEVINKQNNIISTFQQKLQLYPSTQLDLKGKDYIQVCTCIRFFEGLTFDNYFQRNHNIDNQTMHQLRLTLIEQFKTFLNYNTSTASRP